MHTFLKIDGEYRVGMWLPNRDGITAFCSIFVCDSFTTAVTLIHYLNGGAGKCPPFADFREHSNK